MFSWLKPEHALTILFGLVTVFGTMAGNWVTSHDRSVLSDRDMITLQSDVKDIKNSIAPIQLYAQRLTQIESSKDKQDNLIGQINGQVNSVREDLRAAVTDITNIKSDLANIKQASGLTSEGRKMR